MRSVVQTDLGRVKFQGALATSRCMKMRAASIVLLLTVSALAGCTGDSDDAVVWDCRLDVRLDSLPDFSEQSFNDSISEHPGYPEWCGAIVPENLALDGSEPNLPPAEDLYGGYWWGWLRARSATRYVDSWYSQEECSANEGTWDEDYSMCSFPVDCIPEADSQLIYEECLPSQYARYHWSGDYLYIGMPSNSWWIN